MAEPIRLNQLLNKQAIVNMAEDEADALIVNSIRRLADPNAGAVADRVSIRLKQLRARLVIARPGGAGDNVSK
jgi:hypothetical protein